jgi:hypothetical protein
MKGTITRRGKASWRLKFDTGRGVDGKRAIRYITVRGKRQDAERELTKHIHAFHSGTDVEPAKITVAEYLRSWLDGAVLSPKTLERYRQLAEQQIIPHLGGNRASETAPGPHSEPAYDAAYQWWQRRQAFGRPNCGPCTSRHSSRPCAGIGC